MAEEEDYKRCSYRVFHYFRRRIDNGGLSQSNNSPSVKLVCFDYRFPDDWFVKGTYHFRPLLDFKHRVCEFQNPLGVFAFWYCVNIFAIPPSFRSSFYVVSMCPEREGLDIHRFFCFYVPSALLLFGMDLRAWSLSTNLLLGSVWVCGTCSCPNFTSCLFWGYTCFSYWWSRLSRESTFDCIAIDLD